MKYQVILSISLLLLILTSSVPVSEHTPIEKGYISILVHDGDTLWSLSKVYATEPYTTSSFIQETKSINDMSSDTIYAGRSIMIPIVRREEFAYAEWQKN